MATQVQATTGDSIGPALQLAARGPQDSYISTDDPVPGSSWFRSAVTRCDDGYFKHFPFDKDVVRHIPGPSSFFGSTNSVNLLRCGDILGPIFLRVILPALTTTTSSSTTSSSSFTWTPRVGRAMFKRIKLLIDDCAINDHERLYLDILDKSAATSGERAALDALLGVNLSVDTAHELMIPLRFFNCSADSRWHFPWCRATRSEVSIEFAVEDLWKLIEWHDPSVSSQNSQTALQARQAFAISAIRTTSSVGMGMAVVVEAWATHFWLSKAERTLVLANDDPLLIETVQDVDVTDCDMQTGMQKIQSSMIGDSLPGALKYLFVVSYRSRDHSEGIFFQYVPNPFLEFTVYHNGSEDIHITPIKASVQTGLEYGNSCDSTNGIFMITYAIRPFQPIPTGSAMMDDMYSYRIKIDWSDTITSNADVFTAKAFGTAWQRLEFKNGSCCLMPSW